MFLKLIKYDLKSMLKKMIPLWIVCILISAVLGIRFQIGSTPQYIEEIDHVTTILILVFLAIFVALIVLNIVIVIQRFWNGLLKDEGYLMFTLPLSQRKLILSKLISALVISIGSVLTAYIAAIIIGGSLIMLYQEMELSYLIGNLSVVMQEISMVDVILLIVYLIVKLISSIYHLYVSMAIGHLSNRNRFLCSLIAYIVIDVIISTGTTILYEPIYGPMTYTSGSIASIAVVAVESVIYHVITEWILTNRLNLE